MHTLNIYLFMYILALGVYFIKKPLKKIDVNGLLFLINFNTLIILFIHALCALFDKHIMLQYLIEALGILWILSVQIFSFGLNYMKKYAVIKYFNIIIQLSVLMVGLLIGIVFVTLSMTVLRHWLLFAVYVLYLYITRNVQSQLIADKKSFDNEERRNKIAEEMIPVINQIRRTQHEYSNIMTGLASSQTADDIYRNKVFHQKHNDQFESFGKIVPILRAALYMKSKQLEEKKIDFKIYTWLDNIDLYTVNPKEYEMISIIINLINNASEAIIMKRDHRDSIIDGVTDKIVVDMKIENGKMTIKVGNSGKTIDPLKFYEWTEIGVSTKTEGHHGFGLHVILGLCSKYGGSLSLEHDEEIDYIVVNL